jgi:Tol biopolymer transport system component/tRNA A-37 threonylcarbamoyl transferase component Bud32
MSDAPPIDRLKAALASRYEVQRELGQGGMATVYLAEDLKHRRQVALKLLRPDIAMAVGHERFLREIEVAAKLTHPHIVSLIDSGDANGLIYYVMPYIEGESLRTRLAREREVPIPDAIRILGDVADALAYAHARGVVHRDVKPDNVLLTGRHAVVTDFGVAKAVTAATGTYSLTSAGIAIGTPAYMAPEQAMGDPNVDHRADLYAFGVLAYELLVGEVPFAAASAQDVLAKHVTQSATPPSDRRGSIPLSLNNLVLKCLEKRPADRWQRAEEILPALEALVTPTGGTTPTQARLKAFARRRPVLAGVAVLALVGATAWLALRAGPDDSLRTPPVHRQLTFRGDVYTAEISPDGAYIAYLAGQPADTMKLILEDLVGGGAPLTLTSVGILGAGAGISWWPDGSRLMFPGRYQGFPGFVSFPRLGGAPHPIPSYGPYSKVSPDGTRIAFWGETFKHVRLMDLATRDTSTVPLTGSFDFVHAVDWFPSGAALAVATRAGGVSTLWSVQTPGTRQNQLLDEPRDVLHIRTSHRGDAIYYLVGGWRTLELASELRKLRVKRDGAGAEGPAEVVLTGLQIAAPLGYSYPAFSISTDGRRLVYARVSIPSNLWLVSPLGIASAPPAMTQLTHGTAVRIYPRISPDGQWVAYVEVGLRGADVWKMPLKGGEPRQVTFQGNVTGPPAWSPRGTVIAYAARSGNEPAVWLIGAEGGTPRILTQTRLSEYGQLAWAPASHIVYQRPGNRTLFVLDPRTASERPLLRNDAPSFTFEPVSSPDASEVAFQWNRGDSAGLWLASLEDGGAQRVVGGGGAPLAWTMDGLFYVLRSGEVRLLDVRERRERLVGTLPFRRAEVPVSSCTLTAVTRPWAMICARQERSSDAWMIEHFDPAVR